MATDRQLKVVITADDKASPKLRGFEATLQGVARVGSLVASALASAATAAEAAGLGLAKSVLDVGNTVEQARIKLKALFGSAAAGAKAFTAVQTAAAKLPFTFQEILRTAPILANVVKGPEELQTRLMQIAEIASRFPISFEQAAEQFARLSSAGAASADAFREKGVNAFLGIKAGAQISAAESLRLWDNAFAKIQQEGTSATDELAHSETGIVSMLQDKWFQFRQRIAEAGLFDQVKQQLQDLLDRLNEAERSGVLDQWAKSIADAASGAIDALKAVAEQAALVWKSFHPELITGEAGAAAAHRLSKNLLDRAITDRTRRIKEISGELNKLLTLQQENPDLNVGFKVKDLKTELAGLNAFVAEAQKRLGGLSDAEDVAGAAAKGAAAKVSALAGAVQKVRDFSAFGAQQGGSLMPTGGRAQLLGNLETVGPGFTAGQPEQFRATQRAFGERAQLRFAREGTKQMKSVAEQMKAGANAAFQDLGRSLVEGIMTGFKNMADVFKAFLSAFINQVILGPLLGGLHIFSPSLVMAERVGGPIVAGIRKGILDGASALKATMDSLAGDLSSPAGLSRAPAGLAAAVAGGLSGRLTVLDTRNLAPMTQFALARDPTVQSMQSQIDRVGRRAGRR